MEEENEIEERYYYNPIQGMLNADTIHASEIRGDYNEDMIVFRDGKSFAESENHFWFEDQLLATQDNHNGRGGYGSGYGVV